MNRLVRYAAWGLIFLAGVFSAGCVTAHEAQAQLEILDNTNKHKLEDCLLLTIRTESLESQGYWWVAQEEQAGHMVPREVRLDAVSSGDMIDQKGKVMVTIGPYVRGQTMGVEYWLFRPGYQPDDFRNEMIERAYEDHAPLDIHLLPEDAGSSLSDEQVLDGARRVLDVVELLDPNNPEGTRLLTLLIEQVRHVEKNAYKPKWRRHAAELLPKLRKERKRFPAVEVTWRNLPPAPAETPEPVAAASAETMPVAQAPVEPPPAKPSVRELQAAEEKPETASSDLPVAATPKEKPPDEPAAPELIPVDLSNLDDSSPETQPADESAANTPDGTVRHDLEPVRK
ncbi:MAG: hypothetical protein JW849_04080 [Phycisphaerae bacterium]|nr:hypothetical protein [Phycisphaerae bacterium]